MDGTLTTVVVTVTNVTLSEHGTVLFEKLNVLELLGVLVSIVSGLLPDMDGLSRTLLVS